MSKKPKGSDKSSAVAETEPPKPERKFPLGPGMKVCDLESRSLPCKLTTEEQISAGRELANACHEKATLEGRKKAYNDDIKAQIQELEVSLSRLARMAREGVEYRTVDVEMIRDLKANVMRFVRADTGEELSKRALTEVERQDNLFPIGDGPKEVTPAPADEAKKAED